MGTPTTQRGVPSVSRQRAFEPSPRCTPFGGLPRPFRDPSETLPSLPDVTDGSTLSLADSTIDNCSVSAPLFIGSGGALFVSDSSLVLLRTLVSNCHAVGVQAFGGGIAAVGSTILLNGSSLVNTSCISEARSYTDSRVVRASALGGAIGITDTSDVTIYDSVLRGTSAYTRWAGHPTSRFIPANGGAIHARWNSYLTMRDAVISDAYARANGGGIDMGGCRADMFGVRILNCRAGVRGGGMVRGRCDSIPCGCSRGTTSSPTPLTDPFSPSRGSTWQGGRAQQVRTTP